MAVDDALSPSVETTLEKNALQGVSALLKVNEAGGKNPKKKKQLLEDDEEKVILVINLKKIPHCRPNQTKVIKIPLVHSIHNAGMSLCLFVKDVNKKHEDDFVVHQTKELLRSQNINTMVEVITYHQLRTEFKPFEAKRKLCQSHDLFLVDSCIAGYLPKLIGREFWERKRLPVKINMKAQDLKSQFEKVLSSTFLYLNGRGSTCTIPMARLSQGKDQICENLIQAIKEVSKSLPGGWKNVRGLHIKTPRSMAIPVYLSTESPNEVCLEKPDNSKPEAEAEELSTKLDTKVKVWPDGSMKVLRGRDEGETTDEEMDCFELIKKEKRKSGFKHSKQRSGKRRKTSNEIQA